MLSVSSHFYVFIHCTVGILPLVLQDYFNTFCFEIIYLQGAQKFSIVQANGVLSRDICNVKAEVRNVNAIQSSRITSVQHSFSLVQLYITC